MAPSWDALANSPRWSDLVSFIHAWVGPFEAHHGMDPEELDAALRASSLTLPAAVREWYLLAGGWDQGGINCWLPPRELEEDDGKLCILTDSQGINYWGVRAADYGLDDPPVINTGYDPDAPEDQIDEDRFPTFSSFVKSMIINDVLFDYQAEEPVELKPDRALEGMTRLGTLGAGDFWTDAPLGSATIAMFTYSDKGPVYGKARTPEGKERLERLRLEKS